MHRTLCLLVAAAALATAAPAFGDAGGPYHLDAKGKCHDVKGGFVKTAMCKASSNTAMSGGAMSAGSAGKTASTTARTGGHPTCKKGKPCGNSCIAMDKVCHK